MTTELPPSTPDAEEKQLCLSCLTPNHLANHFCAKCGAPLTSYAATAPFESIFAEGSVYRQAAERPHKFIIVLGIWLIFGGMALGGLAITGFSLADQDRVHSIFGALFGLGLIIFSGLIIRKTTRNYLARKRTNEQAPDS